MTDLYGMGTESSQRVGKKSQNVGAPRQGEKSMWERIFGPSKIFKYRASWTTFVPYSQDRQAGYMFHTRDFETEIEMWEFIKVGRDQYQLTFRTFTLIPKDCYEPIETTGSVPLI